MAGRMARLRISDQLDQFYGSLVAVVFMAEIHEFLQHYFLLLPGCPGCFILNSPKFGLIEMFNGDVRPD